MTQDAADRAFTQDVPGGKTNREIAETFMIKKLGGLERVANQRLPIGKKRSHLLETKAAKRIRRMLRRPTGFREGVQ